MARALSRPALAVALAAAALLLCYSTGAAGVTTNSLGGAGSVAAYIQITINSFNARQGALPKLDAYRNTNAPDGVDGWIKGRYVVGFTDAITAGDEDEAKAAGISRITVPVTYTSFSFFVRKADLKSTRKISATNLLRIFRGTVTTWAAAGVTGVAGGPKPIVRADAAGATNVIVNYLYSAARASWPANVQPSAGGPGSGVDTILWADTVIKATGNNALATRLAQTPNGISYMQTGIGLVTFKASNLLEVAVPNLAGGYYTAATAPLAGDIAAALTRPFPSPIASWSRTSLVYKRGVRTYPLVSFILSLWRNDYTTPAGQFPTAGLVKKWGLFVLSAPGQALTRQALSFPLTPTDTSPFLTALRGVRTP